MNEDIIFDGNGNPIALGEDIKNLSEEKNKMFEEIYIKKIIGSCIPNSLNDIEISHCLTNFRIVSQRLNRDYFTGRAFLIYLMLEVTGREDVPLTYDYVENFIFSDRGVLDAKEMNDLIVLLTGSSMKDKDRTNDVQMNHLMSLINEATQKYFEEIKQVNLTSNELKLNLNMLCELKERSRLLDILEKTKNILLYGESNQQKSLFGTNDAINYFSQESSLIQRRLAGQEDKIIRSATFYDYQTYKQVEENNKIVAELLCKTGIKTIDDYTGGIFRGSVIGSSAPSGAGKTRTMSRVTYTALTEYKRNVVSWSGEQGIIQLTTYLISQHCWSGKVGGIRKFITDENIRKNEVPKEDLDFLEAVKMDLFNNSNYGRLHTWTEPFYVENIDLDLKRINKDCIPVDLFNIDYVSLMRSNGNNPSKKAYTITEIVSEAMKEFVALSQTNPWSFWVNNQTTREEIKRLLKGEDATIAGSANSSEFDNSAHVRYVWSATKKQYDNGQLTVHCPKTRFGKAFPSTVLRAKHGVCEYSPLKNNETSYRDDEDIAEFEDYREIDEWK